MLRPFLIYCAMIALAVEAATGQSFFALTNRKYGPWSGWGDAPVLDARGIPLSGTNYLAELWGGATPYTIAPLKTWESHDRAFAGFPGTNGFFWAGTDLYLPDVEPWGWGWLQVRVWDTRLGARYEDVALRGLGGGAEHHQYFSLRARVAPGAVRHAREHNSWVCSPFV